MKEIDKLSEEKVRDEMWRWSGDSRPYWDDYFLALAFLTAQRSLDRHTKHGCVLVGPNHEVLSTGYNGAPRGVLDSQVDLERPGKYTWMEHSERNAIANAARNGIKLLGSTAYITGYPCNECYRLLWQSGITKIMYAPISLGPQYDTPHLAKLVGHLGPTLVEASHINCRFLLHTLQKTIEYFTQRIETPTT